MNMATILFASTPVQLYIGVVLAENDPCRVRSNQQVNGRVVRSSDPVNGTREIAD